MSRTSRSDRIRHPVRAFLLLALVAGATPGTASAAIFGSDPIPISVGPQGQAANGPSGGATVSGDNRRGTLAGFHSEASNLVSGDTNGVADVFVWSRPRGRAGLSLRAPARPAGALQRVSVGGRGAQANGASLNPSLDGSLAPGDRARAPRCVAFESTATNLAGSDRDSRADVYVRMLSARRTVHVSRGIGPAATNPSIDGSCRRVVFEAGGRVYVAPVSGGQPRSLGRGSSPDLSLDGSAIAWERGSSIAVNRAGNTSTIAPRGSNPTVSDREVDQWAVALETGGDVQMRVFRARGGSRRTLRVTSGGGTSASGGLTAFAANRGIVTYVTSRGGVSDLFYRNNNSGNSDDLAHATGPGSQPSIFDVATSARANFVAFTSTGADFPFDRNGPVADVFFKHLIDGVAL